MADTRISDLAAIPALAAGDLFPVVDVSDTSMASSGTDTKATSTQLATFLASASALTAAFQPLDSDLTAIAALATTAYGRALLALVDQAALMASLAASTTALSGIVELATSAETVTGTDTVRAVTPAGGTAAFVKREQPINAQTGTTYTLVAGDASYLVSLSNAGAVTLTVPQDSDATIAVGEVVDLYQLGAGQVTVAAGAGATLRVSGLTAKARAQYSRFAVQKVSANTWVLVGDLAAS